MGRRGWANPATSSEVAALRVLLLPLLLSRSSKAAFLVPGFILVAGVLLRGYLAQQRPSVTGGVSYREFQLWICYPTWTRLDPLVFGVALAAIEKYRASGWSTLAGYASCLWLPGLVAIMYGLYLGERDLTIATCVWQLPLIAFGMAMLLVCSVSPRLPFSRVELPGAAFLASIAYSVYLSHKLVIHLVTYLSSTHAFSLTSIWALLAVHSLIYVTGAVLFFAVERPFLQLRRHIAQ